MWKHWGVSLNSPFPTIQKTSLKYCYKFRSSFTLRIGNRVIRFKECQYLKVESKTRTKHAETYDFHLAMYQAVYRLECSIFKSNNFVMFFSYDNISGNLLIIFYLFTHVFYVSACVWTKINHCHYIIRQTDKL